MERFSTHQVTNQPTPFEGVNLFTSDPALAEGIERLGADWARSRLEAFGAIAGSHDFREQGRLANRYPPELRSHDRFGHRIDQVDYHPAWHEVMRTAMAHGLHNLPWREARPGAQVARSALHAMLSRVEAGACCPLTMTFACWPVVARDSGLAERLQPALRAMDYDPSNRPIAGKASILVGMAMTEKQGGSDLRANSTRAEPLDPDGREVSLVGHKWFCSAPMSDGFLTLAQAPRGLTCYFVPRLDESGRPNGIRIQRLKDKLGNRSNASSEIEYQDARATRIGEEGRGIATILEMVQHTRLDCVSGSTGLMKEALAQAIHHTHERSAFGRALAEQPLMRRVLADLALEVEAATALMLRLAEAFDAAEVDPAQRAFARIATAIGKFWVCKRAPAVILEAMECLGGAGYVEESILPRLYREAPVNAIWEGSGNIMCLDVLRALTREPETFAALEAEFAVVRGADLRLDQRIDRLRDRLSHPADLEADSRQWVGGLAIALQASLLLRRAPVLVADSYLAARLDEAGALCGSERGGKFELALLERALPAEH